MIILKVPEEGPLKFVDCDGNILDTSCLDQSIDADTYASECFVSGINARLTKTHLPAGNQKLCLDRMKLPMDYVGNKAIPPKCRYKGSSGTVRPSQPGEGTSAKPKAVPSSTISMAKMDFIQAVHVDSLDRKPELLKISEIKWKYLVRSILRGKNVLMTGPAGCGKTMAARSAFEAFERPNFYFNLGATQDPRSTLIGNTHFAKDEGTFFAESLFIQAIQTENAVILLDELSRAHPEAGNILMTVLDETQRYLRIDEHADSPTVKVADGVCFIATANIGHEYTSTRQMDKALIDRFTIIEMDLLDNDQENSLLSKLYPDVAPEMIDAICEIVSLTRVEAANENGKIDHPISTRNSVELTSLIEDGFTLEESCEVCVFPHYDSSGGNDSERSFVKQVVQRYVQINGTDDIFKLLGDD